MQKKERDLDELDSKIFRTDNFKDKINRLHSQHNEALSDFNQYFEVMTDLERSPFVPSHINKARKAKEKVEQELAEQNKIKAKYDRDEQKMKQSRDRETEAYRKTNELLSLSDIHLKRDKMNVLILDNLGFPD